MTPAGTPQLLARCAPAFDLGLSTCESVWRAPIMALLPIGLIPNDPIRSMAA